MIQASWNNFAARTSRKALTSAQIIQNVCRKFVLQRSQNLEFGAAIKLQQYFRHSHEVRHQVTQSIQDKLEPTDAHIDYFHL